MLILTHIDAPETGWLIHVDPKTIDINAIFGVEEELKLVIPVVADILGEPVGKHGNTGPDDAEPRRAVSAEKQDVFLNGSVHGRIILVTSCRVNHDNIVLVVVVEVGHKGAELLTRVALRVGGEDEATVHVIDISPHRLKWNVGLAVVIHYLSHSEGVRIAVTALVEAKTPIWLESR